MCVTKEKGCFERQFKTAMEQDQKAIYTLVKV